MKRIGESQMSAKSRKPASAAFPTAFDDPKSESSERTPPSDVSSKRALDARRTTTARAVAALVFAVFLGIVATRPPGETRRYPAATRGESTADAPAPNAEAARSLANGVAKILSDREAELASRSRNAPRIVETSAKETTETADAKPTAPNRIGFVVDLNTATKAELTNLPRIGPTLADRIIEYREANDGFRSVDELIEIDNIGEKTLAKLRPYCVVSQRDNANSSDVDDAKDSTGAESDGSSRE